MLIYAESKPLLSRIGYTCVANAKSGWPHLSLLLSPEFFPNTILKRASHVAGIEPEPRGCSVDGLYLNKWLEIGNVQE